MSGLRSGALASLVRAVSTSLTNLALPLALALILSEARYKEWALTFALASLVLYADLGLPVTIQVLAGRAVADQSTRPGNARASALAALCIASGAAAAALAASALLSVFLGSLYPRLPHGDLTSVAIALMELVAAQSASVITNVASGYFVGVGRNWSMTAVVAPTRVLAAAACCAVAMTSARLPLIGLAYLLPVLAGTGVLVLRIMAAPSEGTEGSLRRHIKEVGRFTAPLLIWGLMMSLVSGLDLVVVGRVDYNAVRDYAIAAALSAGVVGMATAALGPLLAHLAQQMESGRTAAVQHAVVRWGALAGLLAGAGYAVSILLVRFAGGWFGAAPYIALLAVGMTMRTAISPLSSTVVAAGRARRLTHAAVGEAVANLALSIALGITLGAAGVAIGTTIAAFAACLYQLWASGRLVPELVAVRRAVLLRALAQPVLALAPMLAVVAADRTPGVIEVLGAFGCTAALTAAFGWRLVRGDGTLARTAT